MEDKQEMFEIACTDGDYLCARAVIEDTKELGFIELAAQMEEELLALPIEVFTNASPIIV